VIDVQQIDSEAKAKLETAGVQVNEMWDSGVCHGAGVCDPTATPSSCTTATSRTTRPDALAALLCSPF
jgi:hypothetical protein